MIEYVCYLQYGFLDYEAEEGKKLFFHMTEVHSGLDVSPGDDVEFVIVQNQRNGKYSACSLRKLPPVWVDRGFDVKLVNSREH